MRQSFPAILTISSLLVASSGCQQTATGPAAQSPMGPLAPSGSMFPGTSSGISPFGAPTRVTPPSTGSVGAPNAYLGGQVNAVNPGSAGYAAAPTDRSIGLNPIGSGLQNAGWNETAANIGSQNVAPASFNSANTNQNATTAGIQPRLGGMPVIDLTAAPPPPGYRQPYNAQSSYNPAIGFATNPQAGAIGYGVPGNYAGASVTANGTFSDPRSYQANQWAGTPEPSPQGAVGGSSSYVQPQFQVAAQPSLAPAPVYGESAGYAPVAPVTNTLRGPSTDPVSQPQPQPSAPGDLMWRRPGVR